MRFFLSFLSFFLSSRFFPPQVFLALTQMFKYDMSSIRMPLLGSASTIKFQLGSLIRRIASWKIGKFPRNKILFVPSCSRVAYSRLRCLQQWKNLEFSIVISLNTLLILLATPCTRFSIYQSWILRLIRMKLDYFYFVERNTHINLRYRQLSLQQILNKFISIPRIEL